MGNYSRDTFDRLKHYVGVRLQQGVPLIDADWNEQEDIRKFELRAFLKWFAGNGVPRGNDGFLILAAAGTTNNFDIRGGNGTAEGAGRCIVEGLDVMLESTMRYSSQPLYNNPTLAGQWGVSPIAPLTTPATSPAMSTNSTVVGRTFSGLAIEASTSSRGSGTGTTPTLGSIVQNG